MKRVIVVSEEEGESDTHYLIEEFAFNKCNNKPLSIFLRIQLYKGLITEEEFFEILGIEESEVSSGAYHIINW